MSRRAGKVRRSPGKQRRLERRKQEAPLRERRAKLREVIRAAAAEYDELCRASFGSGEWIHAAGWVVCLRCGLVQPYRHDGANGMGGDEVVLAPCMRGELLELPCDGEECETLEAYEEAIAA